MNNDMPGIVIFFFLILFAAGILLGAAVAVKYYEDKGCRAICSGEIELKFDDNQPAFLFDGEKQYKRL